MIAYLNSCNALECPLFVGAEWKWDISHKQWTKGVSPNEADLSIELGDVMMQRWFGIGILSQEVNSPPLTFILTLIETGPPGQEFECLLLRAEWGNFRGRGTVTSLTVIQTFSVEHCVFVYVIEEKSLAVRGKESGWDRSHNKLLRTHISCRRQMRPHHVQRITGNKVTGSISWSSV